MNSKNYEHCYKLLDDLKKQQHSNFFHKMKKAPGVTRRMDIKKLTKKLGNEVSECRFDSPEEFFDCVNLMFRNAQMTYRAKTDENSKLICKAADTLKTYFNKRWKNSAPAAPTKSESKKNSRNDMDGNYKPTNGKLNGFVPVRAIEILSELAGMENGSLFDKIQDLDCDVYKMLVGKKKDLKYVKSRIKSGKITTVKKYISDVTAVFTNSMKYFLDPEDYKAVRTAAIKLLDKFNTMVRSSFTEAASLRPVPFLKVKELQLCRKFLDSKILADQTKYFPFARPWNCYGVVLERYEEIIVKPMDIGTVQTKLNSDKYSYVSDFVEDLKLIFTNAITYYESVNQKGNDLVSCSREFLTVITEFEVNNTSGQQLFVKNCREILKKLAKHPQYALFNAPVKSQMLPAMYTEYKKVVKTMMDFTKVTSKLNHKKYKNWMEFANDVEIIFSNCITYYKQDQEGFSIVTWCKEIQSQFQSLLKSYFPSGATAPPNVGIAGGASAIMAVPPKVKSSKVKVPKRVKEEKFPGSNKCMEVLSKLMGTEGAQWFAHPVDFINDPALRDYPNVVKHPMDFGTIKKKLKAGEYKNHDQFASDARLVFDNCLLYNIECDRNRVIRDVCKRVSKEFERLYSDGLAYVVVSEKFPEQQACLKLLKELMEMKNAGPFNQPVDYVLLNIPEYPQIVKKPMDFGTIRLKLIDSEYTKKEEFHDDVQLVISNCLLFNKTEYPKYQIRTWALNIKKRFETKYAELVNIMKMKAEQAPPPPPPVEPSLKASPPTTATTAPPPPAEKETPKAVTPSVAASSTKTPPPPPPTVTTAVVPKSKSIVEVKAAAALKLKVDPPREKKIIKRKRREGPLPPFEPPDLLPNTTYEAFELSCDDVLRKFCKIPFVCQMLGNPVLETFDDEIFLREYRAVIKNPMDLHTIFDKLHRHLYGSTSEFANDVYLMFDNAVTFNNAADKESALLREKVTHYREFFDDLFAEREGGDIVERNTKRKQRDAQIADVPASKGKLTRVLNKLSAKNKMKANRYFLHPVDWRADGLLDYPSVVTYPMDLGTVKKKLTRNKYNNIGEFASDIRVIFTNCLLYNRDPAINVEIRAAAKEMQTYFESVWGETTCTIKEAVLFEKIENKYKPAAPKPQPEKPTFGQPSRGIKMIDPTYHPTHHPIPVRNNNKMQPITRMEEQESKEDKKRRKEREKRDKDRKKWKQELAYRQRQEKYFKAVLSATNMALQRSKEYAVTLEKRRKREEEKERLGKLKHENVLKTPPQVPMQTIDQGISINFAKAVGMKKKRKHKITSIGAAMKKQKVDSKMEIEEEKSQEPVDLEDLDQAAALFADVDETRADEKEVPMEVEQPVVAQPDIKPIVQTPAKSATVKQQMVKPKQVWSTQFNCHSPLNGKQGIVPNHEVWCGVTRVPFDGKQIYLTTVAICDQKKSNIVHNGVSVPVVSKSIPPSKVKSTLSLENKSTIGTCRPILVSKDILSLDIQCEKYDNDNEDEIFLYQALQQVLQHGSQSESMNKGGAEFLKAPNADRLLECIQISTLLKRGDVNASINLSWKENNKENTNNWGWIRKLNMYASSWHTELRGSKSFHTIGFLTLNDPPHVTVGDKKEQNMVDALDVSMVDKLFKREVLLAEIAK